MKMTLEDKEDVFNFLDCMDPRHLAEGLIVMMLSYFQDHVDEGMNSCLDKKFFFDFETLLDILSVREKYPFEKATDW